MNAMLRGGRHDGAVVEHLDASTRVVRVPVMQEGRVLSPAEWDDPANWEYDEFAGHWRPKRPKIHVVEYQRTDDREGEYVVFR